MYIYSSHTLTINAKKKMSVPYVTANKGTIIEYKACLIFF